MPDYLPSLDNWLDAFGINSAMKLKAIHHSGTFGSWDGESWLQRHRDCASEAAPMELVDDSALDFFCLRICVEPGIDFLGLTSADKLRVC